MKQVLHNIRNRPAHHRDRIIWICAGVAVAILLLIWATVGNGRKTTTDQNFFQSFSQGVNDGKNILPPNPLTNDNANTTSTPSSTTNTQP